MGVTRGVRVRALALLLACGAVPARGVDSQAAAATPAPAPATRAADVFTGSPPPVAPAAAGLFGPDRVGPDGAVVWTTTSIPVPPAVDSLRRALAVAGPGRADTLRAWGALLGDRELRGYGLERLAPLLLAAGDTLGADRAWAALAADRTPWTYEALRGRADLAMLRGDPARADSLLAATDRGAWSDLDRSSWLVRRAELRMRLGDGPQAIEFARQTVRRYPSLPPALRALTDLEQWMKERGQPPSPADERAAAEVEFLTGDRQAAVARLLRAERDAGAPDRARLALRRGEILRMQKEFSAARLALDTAARAAVDSATRAAVELERARVLRDAGQRDAAFAAWARAAALATTDSVREIAWWERLRESEDGDRWDDALEAAERVAALGARHAPEAALRAGIHRLQQHDAEGALAAWRNADPDGRRFWTAVTVRPHERAAADSLLRELAREPGYAFYRMAARETLGVTGWPDTVAAAATRPDPGVRLASLLLAIGARDDAIRVLDRWSQGDPRLAAPLPDSPAAFAAADSAGRIATTPAGMDTQPGPVRIAPLREPRWRQLLAAARIAYGAGRWATGIRYARAAFEAAPDSAPLTRWSVTPWIVPPALDVSAGGADWSDLPGTGPDRPPPPGEGMLRMAPFRPDRGLIYGVVWQESKFDPLARSRSDARGLMQLKLATAVEQARLLRLPVPDAEDLFDPALNLRLGAGYLGRLLQRFDLRPAMALAAYNAGPTPALRWAARLPDPGGEALACELIGYGQAHDYVQIILGLRQAVGEMRPRRE